MTLILTREKGIFGIHLPGKFKNPILILMVIKTWNSPFNPSLMTLMLGDKICFYWYKDDLWMLEHRFEWIQKVFQMRWWRVESGDGCTTRLRMVDDQMTSLPTWSTMINPILSYARPWKFRCWWYVYTVSYTVLASNDSVVWFDLGPENIWSFDTLLQSLKGMLWKCVIRLVVVRLV